MAAAVSISKSDATEYKLAADSLLHPAPTTDPNSFPHSFQKLDKRTN